MTIRLLFTVIVVLPLGLGACQTGTATHGSAFAEKSVEAKPADQSKPIAQETARGIAANCFTCHGPNGKSAGPIPSLSNLSADEIASRVKSFKNGRTASTVMGRHAKAYSDAEIDAIARYIAVLKK
jgi:sulfide dehydrogenase cytochrome subunit